MMLMKNRVVLVGCLLGFLMPVFAQKPGAGWPDNIIITKRLMGKTDLSAGLNSWESALTKACTGIGKPYRRGHITELLSLAHVTEQTIYLSGRKKMVVTNGLDVKMNGDACNPADIVPYASYEYEAPGVRWKATRADSRVQVNNPTGLNGQALLKDSDDRKYQQRTSQFQGKWRRQQYDNIETRFGHRCGYPIDPVRSEALKNASPELMAVAKEAHDFLIKHGYVCKMVESPYHVGTGEALVLHVKKFGDGVYEESTGCWSSQKPDSGQRCHPIITDFKVNASMPRGVFEMPDWARGAASQAPGGKS